MLVLTNELGYIEIMYKQAGARRALSDIGVLKVAGDELYDKGKYVAVPALEAGAIGASAGGLLGLGAGKLLGSPTKGLAVGAALGGLGLGGAKALANNASVNQLESETKDTHGKLLDVWNQGSKLRDALKDPGVSDEEYRNGQEILQSIQDYADGSDHGRNYNLRDLKQSTSSRLGYTDYQKANTAVSLDAQKRLDPLRFSGMNDDSRFTKVIRDTGDLYTQHIGDTMARLGKKEAQLRVKAARRSLEDEVEDISPTGVDHTSYMAPSGVLGGAAAGLGLGSLIPRSHPALRAGGQLGGAIAGSVAGGLGGIAVGESLNKYTPEDQAKIDEYNKGITDNVATPNWLVPAGAFAGSLGGGMLAARRFPQLGGIPAALAGGYAGLAAGAGLGNITGSALGMGYQGEKEAQLHKTALQPYQELYTDEELRTPVTVDAPPPPWSEVSETLKTISDPERRGILEEISFHRERQNRWQNTINEMIADKANAGSIAHERKELDGINSQLQKWQGKLDAYNPQSGAVGKTAQLNEKDPVSEWLSPLSNGVFVPAMTTVVGTLAGHDIAEDLLKKSPRIGGVVGGLTGLGVGVGSVALQRHLNDTVDKEAQLNVKTARRRLEDPSADPFLGNEDVPAAMRRRALERNIAKNLQTNIPDQHTYEQDVTRISTPVGGLVGGVGGGLLGRAISPTRKGLLSGALLGTGMGMAAGQWGGAALGRADRVADQAAMREHEGLFNSSIADRAEFVFRTQHDAKNRADREAREHAEQLARIPRRNINYNANMELPSYMYY